MDRSLSVHQLGSALGRYNEDAHGRGARYVALVASARRAPAVRELLVDATSPCVSHHAGVSYRFCCAGCRRRFDADPGVYVGSCHFPSERGA